MTPWLTVVGIGEDGLDGLGKVARQAVLTAPVVMGGPRHLDLLPAIPDQQRLAWPNPFAAAYDQILARRGTPLCVLASGDPMFFGVGATLATKVPAEEMRVYSAPSSVSLAAARLGWPLHRVPVLPLHGRPIEAMHPLLTDGARLLLLGENADTPARVAAVLRARGFGASPMTVLEFLGGPRERRLDGTADAWSHPPGGDLAVMAITCRADPDGDGGLSRLAGLPDDAFRTDGQITKRDQRAVTLAHLGPRPGDLLWDVGAGSGSIGIEWMRSHPECRAIAIEGHAHRCETIAANRAALGVPALEIVTGRAPEALEGLPSPDAVFIGGGITVDGVTERCWEALKPGGRLVANAVTLESEARVIALHQRWGGTLTHLSVAQAKPLGGFLGWRPAMPVIVWSARKPAGPAPSQDSSS